MNKKIIIVVSVCVLVGLVIGIVVLRMTNRDDSRNDITKIEKEQKAVISTNEQKMVTDKEEIASESGSSSVNVDIGEQKNMVTHKPPVEDKGELLQEPPVESASELIDNEKGLADKEKAERPPEMNQDNDAPRSMLAQINGFVQESKRTVGPEAIKLGEQLLDSTNPVLRVAGTAVLAANDGLTDDVLKKIAEDDDLAVSLNATGWLFDSGYNDAAQSIKNALAGRGVSKDKLLDLIADTDLNSSGSRLALELLSDKVSQDEARDIYGSVGADEAMSYSVRMKALMELKKKVSFVEYRDTVNDLYQKSMADDAIWQEGIKRLSESLQGPVQVLSGTETLMVDDIDAALAREYPMTLEDLAQKLENTVSSDDSYIQEGTAKRLQERLKELNDRPWTEEQQISLNRINAIIQKLKEKEKPLEEAPPLNPGLPPELESK